eukprot:TRINITY_DN586_c0_g1_i4.p1 TRINITY_DN586_c0_g1~~TRINITY_DN586_c0_g1_i4.p1  ORF type:complete len:572 (+),score=116.88 TRINITY_DN586_c0_g1_i4:192-1718(+)
MNNKEVEVQRTEEPGGDDLDDNLQYDLPNDGSENDSDGSEEEQEAPVPKKPANRIQAPELTSLGPKEEIPYTIGIPSTQENLDKILDGQSVERQLLILQRIRLCNHVSFSKENRDKMKRHYTFLFNRLVRLASSPELSTEMIDVLIQPLHELTWDKMGVHALSLFREFLKSMEQKLISPQNGNWGALELIMLRVIGYIWPVSDKRHGIVTPASLLMGQYLFWHPIVTYKDVLTKLYVTNIFLTFLSPAKRFASEPFCFLFSVLDAFTTSSDPDIPMYSPSWNIPPDLLSLQNPRRANTLTHTDQPIHFLLLTGHREKELTDVDRLKVLKTGINLLEQLIVMYTETLSLSYQHGLLEILKVSLAILKRLPVDSYPLPIKSAIQNLDLKLSNSISTCLQTLAPLKLHYKKPMPIRQLEPMIAEPYMVGKPKDKKKRDESRIKKQHKREFKAAERSLRKDAIYLQGLKDEQRREEDEERDAKRRKIIGFLSSQQAELKRLKREKDRPDLVL